MDGWCVIFGSDLMSAFNGTFGSEHRKLVGNPDRSEYIGYRVIGE